MIGRGVTGITLIMVPNDSDLFTRLPSFTFPGTDKERFIWLCNCGLSQLERSTTCVSGKVWAAVGFENGVTGKECVRFTDGEEKSLVKENACGFDDDDVVEGEGGF